MLFRNAPLAAALFAVALLSGCAENVKEGSTAEQKSAHNDNFFEVHREGRVYIFDDAATYTSFLTTGDAAYRITRIGEGPKGESVVFALSNDQRKHAEKEKGATFPMVEMYNGRLKGGEPFYGELRSEGRIYVFDSYPDLEAVRKSGEAAYRYTDVGAGPKGETVVYVLNGKNREQKPVALMEAFRKFHAAR